ncbi:MAG TPA: ABC transporter substrate-binding protein [Sphaerochaeta sp.]|nr:ABC transporter substrate-binding protein [Sphaerochaeta sp.]
MKRITPIMLLIIILAAMPLVAGGDKEAKPTEKVIRIAENVPGLITPGVWDGQTLSMNSSLYEYLIEVNYKTGELQPLLATDWSSPDGKRWTFTLREGVTFHDGSTFDSDDVRFTIERTQDPSVGHLKKNDFAVLESIETPDKYTVILNLKEARPTFIYLMTDYNMAMLSSEYDYAKLGESKPMGTGPFMNKQYIPKESIAMVKNPTYWDPALPKVDKVLIYFVADIEASISMLEADKVDVVTYVTPIISKRLEKVEDLTVVTPFQEQRLIALNYDEEPWGDVRVRQAFKYAMDPNVLARSVTQKDLGEGTEYSETPIMNMLAQYKPLPLRKRDIAKAKQLLADAGYPDGVTSELYYATDHPFSKELAQTVKELAAPAGIDIDLKGYTRDVYLSQYWLDVPIMVTGWAGRIDPYMFLAYAFRGGAPWNELHIDDPTVNSLIDAISQEVDEAKRQTYYDEIQEFFYEQGGLINLQVPYMVAINTRISEFIQPLTLITQLKHTDIIR